MTQNQFAEKFCKTATKVQEAKGWQPRTIYRRKANLVAVYYPNGVGLIMQGLDYVQVCGEVLPHLAQLR